MFCKPIPLVSLLQLLLPLPSANLNGWRSGLSSLSDLGPFSLNILILPFLSDHLPFYHLEDPCSSFFNFPHRTRLFCSALRIGVYPSSSAGRIAIYPTSLKPPPSVPRVRAQPTYTTAGHHRLLWKSSFTPNSHHLNLLFPFRCLRNDLIRTERFNSEPRDKCDVARKFILLIIPLTLAQPIHHGKFSGKAGGL